MKAPNITSSWRFYGLHVARAGFAFAIAVLLWQFSFDYIESIFYDARIRFKPAPRPTGNVVSIVVDSQTISELERIPNAVDHRRLLEALKMAGARAIVSFINPSELLGSTEEIEDFVAAAGATPNYYVALEDVPLRGQKDALRLSSPFERVRAVSAPIPVDRNIFARDDVSRRLILGYQGQPTIFPILARTYNSEIGPIPEGEFQAAGIRGAFEYLESQQTYTQLAPTGTYAPISFRSLRSSTPQDLEKFKDKIVIIGRDIQTTSKDYVRTAYSRDIVAMTLVEMSANMLDTLIRNDAPKRIPRWLDRAMTGLISYLTVIVVLTVTPATGLVILGSTILGYSLLAYLAFWLGGWWIGMAHPFLAIFICYYFFIPYRLIIENRRSWEYYEKNKLLTQVEELKTNFLSMMSHDLKTPIARIQGMADIIRSDANPLSSRQTEAVETLRRSSAELLDFVSGILNLGRIESKAIHLNLQSKDVNALVRDVIEKLEFLARSKNIEIRSELEPLFSTKMDVDLIRQVLTNLVENAIKYSPTGTSVLITSEERDGKIIVQVSDQGPGIPEDELPNIFMKFYRSRNAKGSTIKGSGLGLYLAKYFVGLHKGQIQVDSRLGEGSTFTVELPAS